MKRGKSIDAQTLLWRRGNCSLQKSASPKIFSTSPPILQITGGIQGRLPNYNDSAPKPTAADVSHCLYLMGAPTFAKPRRLTPEKFKVAKAEFEYLDTKSACANHQKAHTHHLCTWFAKQQAIGDYQATIELLNAQTVPDTSLLLPHIQDCTHIFDDLGLPLPFVSVDDIAIASDNMKQHEIHSVENTTDSDVFTSPLILANVDLDYLQSISLDTKLTPTASHYCRTK
ncbi:hypothetical protein ACLKA7_005565 [Drosophila subpalustris]